MTFIYDKMSKVSDKHVEIKGSKHPRAGFLLSELSDCDFLK